MGIKFSNSDAQLEKYLQPINEKDCKHFKSAQKFMLKRNYREAIKEYLMSMIMSKSNVSAHKELSKAYKKTSQYKKAITQLDKAKNISAFDSEIYYELGLNHLLDCNSDEARKNFIRTIKLDPENVNAQIQLAISHELENEDFMALSIYQKIIEQHPRYIPAYSQKASLLLSIGEYEEAIPLFYQILKINHNFHRAYLGIGICFDKLENHSKAVRFYKKYIAKKPNSDTTKSLVGRICEIYSKKDFSKSQLRIVK